MGAGMNHWEGLGLLGNHDHNVTEPLNIQISFKIVMGLSIRIFLVVDDDTLERFPFARYERLLNGDPRSILQNMPVGVCDIFWPWLMLAIALSGNTMRMNIYGNLPKKLSQK
jgi:hypothetical protein